MKNQHKIETILLFEMLFSIIGFTVFLATFNYFWAGIGAGGLIVQLITLLILIREGIKIRRGKQI